MQQYRYPDPITIDMKLDAKLSNQDIPPFILVPFIENMIKHGHVTDPENKAVFHLIKHGDMIQLTAKNTISNHNKDKAGGIGLKNIQKRLYLLYGENHQLEIVENDDQFSIEMRLPL